MYDLIFNYVKTVYSIFVYVVFYGTCPMEDQCLTEPVGYLVEM